MQVDGLPDVDTNVDLTQVSYGIAKKLLSFVIYNKFYVFK